MSKVRELREQRGMTQAQLAMVFDVDQACISRWESGETIPVKKHRRKLAHFFGVEEKVFERQRGENSH